MFGKVLLLALVCVAATEVRGNDSECNTEEALRRADNTFHQIASSIRYVLDVLADGRWVFDKTGQTNWGRIWKFADAELMELEKATAELTNTAKEQNRPGSVFTCILDKDKKASEVLRVMPWVFDEKFAREIRKYTYERNQMASKARYHMDTYLSYYRNNIVKALEACDTNECLEEILTKYEEEYERMSEEFAVAVEQMDVQVEEFNDMTEARVSASKGTFTFARIAGVEEMKECLVAGN